MEQPQEETPEVREEEEKEEVAEAEGAPELNGGPELALPSSSYTGEKKGWLGTRGRGAETGGTELLALCKQHPVGAEQQRETGARWPGFTPLPATQQLQGLGQIAPFFLENRDGRRCGLGLLQELSE